MLAIPLQLNVRRLIPGSTRLRLLGAALVVAASVVDVDVLVVVDVLVDVLVLVDVASSRAAALGEFGLAAS